MSSIFDLPERVQRLRQMFSYFRNASLLTGAEVRDVAHASAEAQEEWSKLIADVRACLAAAEALTGDNGDPVAAPSNPPRVSEDLSKAFARTSPASTLH